MRVHVVSRDDVLWCGYRVRGLLVELVLSFHLYLILETKFWSAGLYGKCLSSLDGLAGPLSPRSRVAALGFLLCWPLLLSLKASAAKLKGLIFFFSSLSEPTTLVSCSLRVTWMPWTELHRQGTSCDHGVLWMTPNPDAASVWRSCLKSLVNPEQVVVQRLTWVFEAQMVFEV